MRTKSWEGWIGETRGLARGLFEQRFAAVGGRIVSVMRENLFKAVKREHHLKSRRQLQLYLKRIGLPLEEALVFFKTEFTKKPGCNNEKFEKVTRTA